MNTIIRVIARRHAAAISPRRWLLVAVAAALATSAGRASAAAPTNSVPMTADTVYACYVPKTGTMYRVNATGAPVQCKQASHMPMKWDASGVSGTYTVESSLTRQPGESPWVSMQCPTGHALSGGFNVDFANYLPPYPDVRLLGSGPGGNTNRGNWGFRLANSGSQAVNVTLYVVCGSR